MSQRSDDLLIEGLAADLLAERALSTELAVDLETTRLLLSDALTALARVTTTAQRQADTLRRLMQLAPRHERLSFPPLDPLPDEDLAPEMVRSRAIRWAAFDVR